MVQWRSVDHPRRTAGETAAEVRAGAGLPLSKRITYVSAEQTIPAN